MLCNQPLRRRRREPDLANSRSGRDTVAVVSRACTSGDGSQLVVQAINPADAGTDPAGYWNAKTICTGRSHHVVRAEHVRQATVTWQDDGIAIR